MQTILSQLNSVPGVVGSLVCDRQGRLASHVFPPLFDLALLEQAAATLADGALGLEVTNGGVDAVDFRFGEARLVVKASPDALLVVLCGRATNPQFLSLSLSVAAGKISKLLATSPALVAPPGAPAPAAISVLPAVRPEPRATAPEISRGRRPSATAPSARPGVKVAAPEKGLAALRQRLASPSPPSGATPPAGAPPESSARAEADPTVDLGAEEPTPTPLAVTKPGIPLPPVVEPATTPQPEPTRTDRKATSA